jgi:hypothetical protein
MSQPNKKEYQPSSSSIASRQDVSAPGSSIRVQRIVSSEQQKMSIARALQAGRESQQPSKK